MFNQTFDNFDGYTHSHDSIAFTLTDTSGTWASAANVLGANAQGFYVAIHGFACTAPCDPAAGALTTGTAANGGPVNTPEPASFFLLGAGVAEIGMAEAETVSRITGSEKPSAHMGQPSFSDGWPLAFLR